MRIQVQKRQRVFDLDRAREAIRDKKPYPYWGMDIIPTVVDNVPINFVIDKVRDPIQRSMLRGNFYERKDLDYLRTQFPEDGVFVDIGANVGNHTLYAGKFMKASKVIPFEPNPEAYRLLLANVACNGLADIVDLSHIGLGVSDSTASGFGMDIAKGNLGASRLVEGSGEIDLIKGDDALANDDPDFIKIDVEGMEMEVLAGLEETLKRARPILMVEVGNEKEDIFLEWADRLDFVIIKTFVQYSDIKNHVLKPKEESDA